MKRYAGGRMARVTICFPHTLGQKQIDRSFERVAAASWFECRQKRMHLRTRAQAIAAQIAVCLLHSPDRCSGDGECSSS